MSNESSTASAIASLKQVMLSLSARLLFSSPRSFVLHCNSTTSAQMGGTRQNQRDMGTVVNVRLLKKTVLSTLR